MGVTHSEEIHCAWSWFAVVNPLVAHAFLQYYVLGWDIYLLIIKVKKYNWIFQILFIYLFLFFYYYFIAGEPVYRLLEARVCRFLAEVLLRQAGKFNLKDFLSSWQQSVPEG